MRDADAVAVQQLLYALTGEPPQEAPFSALYRQCWDERYGPGDGGLDYSQYSVLGQGVFGMVAARRKQTAGERLVADLSRDDDPYGITVMVTEAGRIADRLDALAALLSGARTAWLSLKLGRDKTT